jgi:hypothetical protein
MGHLKRFWNNLLVSRSVLDQLIEECEVFALTYYSKKIQKQWRMVRIRRHFEVVVNRSRYLSSLTQKAKLWKAEAGFSISIAGRCASRIFQSLHEVELLCFGTASSECKCKTFALP